MRLRLTLIATVLSLGVLLPASASATACAGANPCPWTSTTSFGQFAATSLGFPNAVLVSAGHLWIADSDNRVVELNATNGAAIGLFGHNGGDGTSGTAAGEFSDPHGLAVDASGNIWVADNGNNRLQELSPTGAFIKAIGWGVSDGNAALETCTSNCQAGIAGSGSGQFNNPNDVAIDPSGNLWVADFYNNRLEELSPAGAFKAAIGWGVSNGGNGFQTCTTTCQAGLYTTGFGGFEQAISVVATAAGIYAADYSGQRIEQFQLTTPFTPVASVGTASNGQFYYPIHVSADPAGNIWISDHYCRPPQVYSPALVFSSALTPNKPCDRQPGDLLGSSAVAFDASGDVYIGDYQNRVQEFDSTPARAFVTGFDDPHVVTSGVRFNGPVGIAYDGSGDLFVADTGNQRLLKINPAGTAVLAVAGANGGDGGASTAPGQFTTVEGVALDPTGTFVYAVDQDNCTLQKFSAATLAYVATLVAGPCSNSAGGLNGPRDVAVDASGNIYVSEAYGSRVDEFDATGTFIRRWGRQSGNGASGTGPGWFSNPLGIGFDSQGDLVVTDSNNNLMQTFSPTGTFLGEFGDAGTSPGSVDSPRTPRADAGGDTVVADFSNDRLAAFAPDGSFLQQWGATGTGAGQLSGPGAIAVHGSTIAATDYGASAVTTFTFPAPTAANTPVSAVATASATLNGTVDPGGGAAAYRWEYGPTSAYGTLTPPQTVGGSGAQAVSATITGLDPGTIYHAGLIATSPGGSSTTQDFTFTTATGATGTPGATGSAGSAGAGGSPGPTGSTGPIGPAGPAGARGQAGANGTASCKLVQPAAPKQKKSKHAKGKKHKKAKRKKFKLSCPGA